MRKRYIACNRALALRFAVTFLAYCPTVAMTDDSLWETQLREAVRFQELGRYPEAESACLAAVKEAEKFASGDLRLATSLNNLALLYKIQARYAEAEPMYQRALGIVEKALGPEHPNLASILNNIAELDRTLGKYPEAEAFCQRALAIREAKLGPVHPELAQSLNSLAALYFDRGQTAQAQPVFLRVLAIQENALGPEHPKVATTLNNLAELYRTQGKPGQAEPLYQRALVIWQKTFGSDHPDIAMCQNSLAVLVLRARPLSRGRTVPLERYRHPREGSQAWTSRPRSEPQQSGGAATGSRPV
jgi:tetratricopeptide (TPR) repeat protein